MSAPRRLDRPLSAVPADRLGSTQPYRMRLRRVVFCLSETRGRVAEDRGSASRRDESAVSARGRAPMPSCESRAGRAESEARSVARRGSRSGGRWTFSPIRHAALGVDVAMTRESV